MTTDNGGTKVTTRRNATTATNSEQLAVFVQLLVERAEFARQHGMMYGNERDIYKVGGYPRTINYDTFRAYYERDPLAGQIVDMAPEATWRKPPEVIEPEDGATSKSKKNKTLTEFETAWADLAKRLGIWQRFERIDRLSRIGRYAVLLIGDGTDDKDLKTPMTRLTDPDRILYLSSHYEGHAAIDTWIQDPTNPRFGMPETYKINLTSGVTSFKAGQSVVVHHTRVIHIAEGLSSDEVYGRPALQRVFNDLFDLQKVTTSTAEAYWQRVAGILTGVVDPEAGTTDEQLRDLSEELRKLYHELSRTFLGRGVELKRLAETEPNPKAAADLLMLRIATGAGYPKRLLFGSETGERASSEDQKTYLGSIAERQRQHAEPAILRPFIDRLIEFGALPRVDYEIVWPPLFQESEREMAEANRARAEAAKALAGLGGDALSLVEIDEDRDIWLRPTGERGELTPEELEPPEPETPEPPAAGERDIEREAMDRDL